MIDKLFNTLFENKQTQKNEEKIIIKRKERIREYMNTEDYCIDDEDELLKTIATVKVTIPSTNNFIIIHFNKLERSVTYDSRSILIPTNA